MPVKVDFEKRTKEMLDGGLDGWREVWRAATASGNHGYFLAWPWVENWLRALPLDVDVYLACIDNGRQRGACFLGYQRQIRHRIIHSDAYFLHYTGLDLYDNLTLEYNHVPGVSAGEEALAALLDALPGGWDELHLPALDAARFPADSLGKLSNEYLQRTYQQKPSYYVDLTAVGPGDDDYLMLLSGNTRSGIRRARKKLTALGPLELIPAETLEEALGIYDELIDLHQRLWKERGGTGAFGEDWFRRFHRRLISERFDYGETQLLRISCGGHTLGCLYNFVYYGKVFYYQSGFDYERFGKYKPGLVCHSLAVPHNAGLGHKVYDFLAGDSQYKQSLSTNANQMLWCVVQKKRIKFLLENSVRGLIRKNTSNTLK